MKKMLAVLVFCLAIAVAPASACLYCDIDNNYDIDGGNAVIKDNTFDGGNAVIKDNVFEGGDAKAVIKDNVFKGGKATIEEGAIVVNPNQTIKQKVKQSVVVEAPDMTPVGDGLTNMGNSIKQGMNNQAKAHVVGTVITEIGDNVEQVIENHGNKEVQKLENKGKVKVQKLENKKDVKVQKLKNKGNKEVADINRDATVTAAKIMEPKRDHIRGPEIVKPDVKLNHDSKPSDTKTYGGTELLGHVDYLYWDQARMLSKETPHVKITKNILFKNNFKTDRVYIRTDDPRGKFMGYLYGDCKGKKCTAAGMVGEAAEVGMKIGATHVIHKKQTAKKEAEGGAWNIGIGGGASIMTNGDDTAIAPNGGLGYGKASASNEMRPAMVFEVWYDEATVTSR